MTTTDALELKLNAPTDTEAWSCKRCGEPADEILCSDCLAAGFAPTYRKQECLVCGHTWLESFLQNDGSITPRKIICSLPMCEEEFLRDLTSAGNEASQVA